MNHDPARVEPVDHAAVMTRLREDEVPEPSPLFWTHLSARVRDAVAHEEAGHAPVLVRGWRDRRLFGWAAGAVAVALVAILGVAVAVRPSPSARPAVAAAAIAAPATSSAGLAMPDLANDDVLDSDPSWAVIADLTAGMDWDDAAAAGLVVSPGAADGALDQLSGDEQRTVLQILQQEMARSKPL